jgi:hypothetical protein
MSLESHSAHDSFRARLDALEEEEDRLLTESIKLAGDHEERRGTQESHQSNARGHPSGVPPAAHLFTTSRQLFATSAAATCMQRPHSLLNISGAGVRSLPCTPPASLMPATGVEGGEEDSQAQTAEHKAKKARKAKKAMQDGCQEKLTTGALHRVYRIV